ncbi:MAG: hypothetical protein CVU11_12140 [Bacteroidetes bacterium HGW-Bacteroidetes-6]|jgi:ribosomal protein S18 acetylase RimI-like enzyme|nr:MAG: hypothetical protein CVU11_12140 [Bacteroidetes bacterium HGW-Bacteroidetes-6]
MKIGQKKDQLLVVDILTDSFFENPSANWVVKSDSKIRNRIRELCKYAFKTSLMRRGVFISSDRKGAALCYKYNFKKNNLLDYWNQLVLAIKAIGLSRLPSILKREAFLNSKRPKSGEYLYMWFLGVSPGFHDGHAASELKDTVLELSDKQGLPIYLETSIEKNRRVYERFGFEIFDTWHEEDQGVLVYFMRRMPTIQL